MRSEWQPIVSVLSGRARGQSLSSVGRSRSSSDVKSPFAGSDGCIEKKYLLI